MEAVYVQFFLVDLKENKIFKQKCDDSPHVDCVKFAGLLLWF